MQHSKRQTAIYRLDSGETSVGDIKIRESAEYNKRANTIMQWLSIGGHDLTLRLTPEQAAALHADLDYALEQYANERDGQKGEQIEPENVIHITTVVPRADGTASLHLTSAAGFCSEIQVTKAELQKAAARSREFNGSAYGVCTK